MDHRRHEDCPPRHGTRAPPGTQPIGTTQVSSSASCIRRPTSDESWIEVSSQPSSSSLSSATTEDMLPEGLRVTQSMNARRRRRLHRSLNGQISTQLRAAGGASSQEEYGESDNESDNIMSSSNENMGGGFRRDHPLRHEAHFGPLQSPLSSDAHSTTSDDDENATALGVAEPSQVFTPQPNAFTHPPASRVPGSTSEESYVTGSRTSNPSSRATASTQPTSQSTRQSLPRSHTRTRSHTPYNLLAPNHSVPIDHDAALRASLSTLLSCAAAARGLPKREGTSAPSQSSRPLPSNRIDQGTLRLIPESSLDSREASAAPPLPRRPSQRSNSSDSPASMKRKSKSPSHDRRKKRRAGLHMSNEDTKAVISPTLMTWVVGAGVMVLFSAISFSAGYALGKEVGRVEAVGTNGLSCASEAESGLGRLRGKWRWGNTLSASGVGA